MTDERQAGLPDGAIRHRTPHPENRAKCGGCRLQDELTRLRAQVPAQEERLGVETALAAAIHEACDWEHYMGHEPSERDEMLAASFIPALARHGVIVHTDTGECFAARRALGVESKEEGS